MGAAPRFPADPTANQFTESDWLASNPAGAIGNAPRTGGPDGYAALRYGLFAPTDGQSHIVSPRRRMIANSGAVAIPATGQAAVSAQVTLQDNLTQDDGFLFEGFYGTVTPTLSDGALTITDQLFALQTGAGVTVIPLATPIETTLQPRFVTSIQLPPPPLITARDIDQFMHLLGLGGTGGLFGVGQQPMIVRLQLGFNNTAAGARNVTVAFWLMYRLVQGLTGA